MAAQSAVFNPYELLESVLSYLPYHDLGNARAVCKDFDKVILRSARTRQAMYLDPAPVHEVLIFKCWKQKDSPAPTITTPSAAKKEANEVSDGPYVISEKHPLLRGNTKDKLDLSMGDADDAEWFFPELDDILAWEPSAPNARVRWEDQLTLQPACKSIDLTLHMHTKDEVSCRQFHHAELTRTVENENGGVRLGEVVEALREMVREGSEDLGITNGWIRNDKGRLYRLSALWNMLECDFERHVIEPGQGNVLESSEPVRVARRIEAFKSEPDKKCEPIEITLWGERFVVAMPR